MRNAMGGKYSSKCRLGPPLVPGGLPSLEIGAKLVLDIRQARQNEWAEPHEDTFPGEKEIWDARDAMALDESDGWALDQYIGAVVGLRFARMIAQVQLADGQKIGKVVPFQFRRFITDWSALRARGKRTRLASFVRIVINKTQVKDTPTQKARPATRPTARPAAARSRPSGLQKETPRRRRPPRRLSRIRRRAPLQPKRACRPWSARARAPRGPT